MVNLIDTATNEVVATATTDDNGVYTFSDVAAGTYIVAMDINDRFDLSVMGPQIPAGDLTASSYFSGVGIQGIDVNGSDLMGYNLGVWMNGRARVGSGPAPPRLSNLPSSHRGPPIRRRAARVSGAPGK